MNNYNKALEYTSIAANSAGTAQEKMAMGDHYISHETNLKAWDKPFYELSPLKQKRVLQSIEDFSKLSFHGIIGSGIGTNRI